MRVLLDHDRVALFHGDSGQLTLPENSVDSIISDPPSGISFMGKSWDTDKGGRDAWIDWLASTLAPSYRALKPGGHGLFWALPRTSHWTVLALELAGFEIRDRVSHFFGTGFPKSLTAASADIPVDTGTALKPAVEDWWLVRKPTSLTVEQNFARWQTGVLNIGACRIGHDDTRGTSGNRSDNGWRMAQGVVTGSADGRWPAHLTLDEEAAALLDAQSNGEVSRFFYVAKPNKAETEAGLDHLPVVSGADLTGRQEGSAGLKNPRAGAGAKSGARNSHPTKKPLALMDYLIRLITPPGGVVLDPFAGSGTTGIAAIRGGWSFIGCEQGGGDGDPYLPILLGRIRHALGLPPEIAGTETPPGA